MSAAARAEARRKAILSRGTDRLAKLTTSARGEDAPAYLHDGGPLISHNMPTPARTSVSPSPGPQPAGTRRGTTPSRNANIFESLAGNATDPSVWLPEQQQQFMQALMNASAGPPSQPSPFGEPQDPIPPMDNPFAALLGPQAAAGAGGGMFPPMGPGMAGKFPLSAALGEPKPKNKLQKVMPLLHLIAMWCLLAYFVLWAEPMAYREAVSEDMGLTAVSFWRRWADLGQKNPSASNAMQTFRLQIVPFFWAFTTLQIALHSLRIFSGFDTVQPPTLLALALPHLPPPLPSLIINSLKYMQMGTLFLDDLSGIVVGIGFIIYFSGWVAPAT
ncbi:hypothetical protein GALMADRAFT_104453 [Galerina marginata CBS 339.88]|uniref:Golgi to ER traffic protein 2 n=1 Tax=Galerina marginata (strain CBS 339.88) TaxID=685588 RepID=A0A067SLS0_GALM3|nr:hypothetical protein GALMADRAFT_104453 [Galerina marginata CBS 339.88]